MKIKINKIFNKYDVLVDISKRVSIFIGENGIGKSTVLKIIDCILKGDFAHISLYYFKSLDLEENDNKIHIDYDNIIPKKSAFYSSENLRLLFRNFTDDEYHSFFRDSLLRNKYSVKLEKKICSLNKTEDYSFFRSVIKDDFFDIYSSIEITTNLGITYFKDSCFDHIFFIDVYKMLEKYINNKTVLINMTDKFNVINNYENIKLFCDEEYKKTKSYKQRVSEDIDFTLDLWEEDGYPVIVADKENDKVFDNAKELREYLNKITYSFVNLEDYDFYIKKYGVEHLIKNIIFDEKNNNYDLYEDLKTGKINLNKLLLNCFYNDDVKKTFLNDYYTYINDILNKKEEDSDKCLDINPVFLSKLNCYLHPLIPKNSLFDYDILLKSHFDFEDNLFLDFVGIELPKLLKITNEKIENFKYLLNKYFRNKSFDVTPLKLVISSNDKVLLDDIEIDRLSTGELKLIIIFVISIFTDNIVLLLDEPETSLSVVWQEELIPDLLEYTNVKNIIISTQSPSIVYSDELLNFVIGLPIGDMKNE